MIATKPKRSDAGRLDVLLLCLPWSATGICAHGFGAVLSVRHPLRALDCTTQGLGGLLCIYIYKHIPAQIINSNSLGGEISRHLTFLSVSLLYFLMFLFWIVISVVETWCYLDRCSVWWLWHGNQFPLDQSGGWWFWFHVVQEQPAGGLTAWHLFLTPGSDSYGSWRLASLQWGASRCSSRWSSVGFSCTGT